MATSATHCSVLGQSGTGELGFLLRVATSAVLDPGGMWVMAVGALAMPTGSRRVALAILVTAHTSVHAGRRRMGRVTAQAAAVILGRLGLHFCRPLVVAFHATRTLSHPVVGAVAARTSVVLQRHGSDRAIFSLRLLVFVAAVTTHHGLDPGRVGLVAVLADLVACWIANLDARSDEMAGGTLVAALPFAVGLIVRTVTTTAIYLAVKGLVGDQLLLVMGFGMTAPTSCGRWLGDQPRPASSEMVAVGASVRRFCDLGGTG